MKKIVTVAAVLTGLGSGAALAQGAPPSLVPWQSGWLGSIETHPNQAMDDRNASVMRPKEGSMTARRGRPVPVAGNVQDTYRKS